MKKAIFLDRDGVINELIYYSEQGIVDSPMISSQVRLVYGIEELIKGANELGFVVVVCSNQPGIGLGKNTTKNLNKITDVITSQLKLKGAIIDKFYYCMHHPYAKIKHFRVNCACRKPKVGLFLNAAKDLGIDLSRSWVVGDGVDDVKAGEKAGCKTILLANVSATENLRIIENQFGSTKPDFVVKNLLQALEVIKSPKK